jgi:hexokinase
MSGKKTNFNPVEIDDFARYYGFHYDCCDSGALIKHFRIAMERGLVGRSSSLAMIPSHLSAGKRTAAGKRVIAIDAGGTNFRAARIKFNGEGGHIMEDKRNMPMPGTSGPLTADEFFSAIADFCEPLFDGNGIAGVGFCFSYPMETGSDGDGVPLSFSKEVELGDLIGRPVGKGFRDALVRRNVTVPEKITLLNDTVAALLCGLLRIPPQPPSKLAVSGQNSPPKILSVPEGQTVGLILGTGFNIAYCEKSIPKAGFESETNPQIVVCEAGNFDFGRQGILDREFDRTTKEPGQRAAEKAVSGAYLGPLSLLVLKCAVKEGVLRFKKSQKLLGMDSLTTKDLNTFLQEPLVAGGPLGGLFGADEADAIRTLVYLESLVTERAALITASALAAVVGHCENARDPLAPVRIAVEGSTFSAYHFLEEALRARLNGLLNADGPRFCIVQAVEQASLLGAAVAALL